jgi:putative FmdB family regulatory protein
MPTYEYECNKCHHRFDLLRSFKDDSDVHCPKCKGKAGRIFTSVPVIFKGSGFYVTDHRKQDSSASATETKTESKEPVVSPKKD